MKKLLVMLLTFAICAGFVSCSCGNGNGGKTGSDAVSSDALSPSDTEIPASVYVSLIDLLREELERARADQDGDVSLYEGKISELEAKLKQAEAEKTATTAAESETSAPVDETPFTYTVSGGEAVITGYSGDYTVLAIPEKLGGYPVTGIADSAFAGSVRLSSVSVPDGVKSLGWFAFSGCTGLKSLTLPASVNEIGYDAFAYCTKLIIYCQTGSFAEKYARSYGISCIAG